MYTALNSTYDDSIERWLKIFLMSGNYHRSYKNVPLSGSKKKFNWICSFVKHFQLNQLIARRFANVVCHACFKFFHIFRGGDTTSLSCIPSLHSLRSAYHWLHRSFEITFDVMWSSTLVRLFLSEWGRIYNIFPQSSRTTLLDVRWLRVPNQLFLWEHKDISLLRVIDKSDHHFLIFVLRSFLKEKVTLPFFSLSLTPPCLALLTNPIGLTYFGPDTVLPCTVAGSPVATFVSGSSDYVELFFALDAYRHVHEFFSLNCKSLALPHAKRPSSHLTEPQGVTIGLHTTETREWHMSSSELSSKSSPSLRMTLDRISSKEVSG